MNVHLVELHQFSCIQQIKQPVASSHICSIRLKKKKKKNECVCFGHVGQQSLKK